MTTSVSRSTRSRRDFARNTTRPCLSVNRYGHAFVNPGADFVLEPGDDAVVVAESLGQLAPLEISDLNAIPRSAAVVPSA